MSILNGLPSIPQTTKASYHNTDAFIVNQNNNNIETNNLEQQNYHNNNNINFHYPHISNHSDKLFNQVLKRTITNPPNSYLLPPLSLIGQKNSPRHKLPITLMETLDPQATSLDNTHIKKNSIASNMNDSYDNTKIDSMYKKIKGRLIDISSFHKSDLSLNEIDPISSSFIKKTPIKKATLPNPTSILSTSFFRTNNSKMRIKPYKLETKNSFHKSIEPNKDPNLEYAKISQTIDQIIYDEIKKRSLIHTRNKYGSYNKKLRINKSISTDEKKRYEMAFMAKNRSDNLQFRLIHEHSLENNSTITKRKLDFHEHDPSASHLRDNSIGKNEIYKIEATNDYTIKVNDDIKKELLEIESHRTKEDNYKMERLLRIREKLREKYFGEEKSEREREQQQQQSQMQIQQQQERVRTIEDKSSKSPSSLNKVPNNNISHNLIKYEDNVMPFSLAVLAKIRQTLVKEIKTIQEDPKIFESRKYYNRAKKIQELKDKILPEEEAKYINEVNEQQKQRRLYDLKCKSSNSNAYYSFFALDNTSKKKLKQKLDEILPQASRFRDL